MTSAEPLGQRPAPPREGAEARRRDAASTADGLTGSEEHLRLALASGAMGTWDWDAATGRVTWSPEVERLYGMAPGTFDGTFESYVGFQHLDDRPEVVARIQRAIADGSDYEIEHRVVWPDGTIHWLAGRGRARLDEQGNLARMAGVVMDVTQRRHAEEERAMLLDRERAARADAEAAVRQRDEFLSVAAHELKTPLTSLRGYAQLARRRLRRSGTLDVEQVERALEVIEDQSVRLSSLVSLLLDVSRIESGRLGLERERDDVRRLVRTTVDAARLRNSGRRFALHAPPDPLWAEIDSLRLEQVLANLLDNSAKYSQDGEPIDVDLGATDALVEIVVRDRGVGVPAEHRARIFDRFYQVGGGAAKPGLTGLGLGLYISRQIVELHGGTITAEFPEDGGTRMVVTLPVVAAVLLPEDASAQVGEAT